MESFKQHFRRTLQRWNGCTIDYTLSLYKATLKDIVEREPSYTIQSDAQLKVSAWQLRAELRTMSHDELLVHAGALYRQAAHRVVKMRPFDVQILGGLAMFDGKLAEMPTGEGKTLAAVLPAFLHALAGKGVHILTFNDYLARRDATWMGPIYEFLGLTVGFVGEGMTIGERQRAYGADVTYVTAKEAGFDYLRDSLCYDASDLVHRPFHCAIVDEADSILIDEARIPLVIAGSADESVANPYVMADVARRMESDVDFQLDDYARNIHLTEHGQKLAEKLLHCKNLYTSANLDILTSLHNALHAEYLLHSDVDYIVRDGKIELVDEFTGRIAEGRRWPDGLQAALEAKENIDIQSKGHILNQITLQHYIRFYPILCGMTATAQASEIEFKNFYNLDIAVIPPNVPCIRQDHDDVIFASKETKQSALLDEIIRVHQSHRPVLVGTSSVKESAHIATALKERGIPCQVLNAKHDAREAEIIAQAGALDAVTISTNMAGRGTDIRLGGADEAEKRRVVELGGLYVLGTNRYESERIDQQLRGRAGRQGDPGASRFFISLQDDLMIKYRLRELLPQQLVDVGDDEIDHPVIRQEVARIQRICDGQNLEIKKTLCKYSDLLEKQRVILFERRMDALLDDAASCNMQQAPEHYSTVLATLGDDKLQSICRTIILHKIDAAWSNYLAEIADIREGIHLKRLGGRDPYIEFQKLAVQIFDALLDALDDELFTLFNSLAIKNGDIDLQGHGLKAPTATWTYLINDSPFENQLGAQMIGNIGLQVSAGMLGPLVALQLLFRKKKK
ncbi:accessory Sec system translocase SecA2 [candidate division KSB1 bacterium]|nr:accessory Sec system translocase SecA2 [candidate division KSB1 bacterium]RQW09423.1 MAG: accessory Sec system translocase SecA2 [candidate division KSB1 bacterium]